MTRTTPAITSRRRTVKCKAPISSSCEAGTYSAATRTGSNAHFRGIVRNPITQTNATGRPMPLIRTKLGLQRSPLVIYHWVGGTPQVGAPGKSSQLLLAKISDHPGIMNLRGSAQIAAEEAGHQPGSSRQVRRLKKPGSGLNQHEQRMVTSKIIGPPVLDPIGPSAIGGSCRAVMKNMDIGEGSRRPAETVGFDLIDGVPTGGLNQATNRLPAPPFVNLGSAANMKPRIIPGLCSEDAVARVPDRPSTNAQARLQFKPLKTPSKIIGLESHIAVEL